MSKNSVIDKSEGRDFKKQVISKATNFTTYLGLNLGIEKNGLICLAFHAVVSENHASDSNSILPALGLRIVDYRQIFESFLRAGYVFVSAKELCEGLTRGAKYVHVTFDDGYFNNLQILPLLSEYTIPIHIFVATSNIILHRKYWWDVVYKRMCMLGKGQAEISAMIDKLKWQNHQEIVKYLNEEFGPDSFTPDSDVDRPLTPDELKTLSKHPLVTIGNHTRDHIIMDRSSEKVLLEQVAGAQQDLLDMTGYEPFSFAFPNGNYSNEAIRLLDSMGFKLGFSCDLRVNHLKRDLLGERRLKLGRFVFISSLDLDMQCRMFRVPNISPIILAKRLRKAIA